MQTLTGAQNFPPVVCPAAGTPYLKVYPNPSKGTLIVEYIQNAEETALLEIFSATGNCIRTLPLISQWYHEMVDLRHEARGIYLMKVTGSGGALSTVRFALQ